MCSCPIHDSERLSWSSWYSKTCLQKDHCHERLFVHIPGRRSHISMLLNLSPKATCFKRLFLWPMGWSFKTGSSARHLASDWQHVVRSNPVWVTLIFLSSPLLALLLAQFSQPQPWLKQIISHFMFYLWFQCPEAVIVPVGTIKGKTVHTDLADLRKKLVAAFSELRSTLESRISKLNG